MGAPVGCHCLAADLTERCFGLESDTSREVRTARGRVEITCSSVPVAASHSRTEESAPPVAMRRPCGLNATQITSKVWPDSVNKSSPSSRPRLFRCRLGLPLRGDYHP